MVGINSRKEYLPHHTIGSKEEGGDAYLKKSFKKEIINRLLDRRNRYCSRKGKAFQAFLMKICIIVIYKMFWTKNDDGYVEGNWYGNRTISRTITDLNKIIFFADKNGKMSEKKQRKNLIVADMVISGEKEGPVAPTPKEVGVIAVGEDPVYFDEVIATLMGARVEEIPTIQMARSIKGKYRYADEVSHAEIVSNVQDWDHRTIKELSFDELLHFIPSVGWEKIFI